MIDHDALKKYRPDLAANPRYELGKFVSTGANFIAGCAAFSFGLLALLNLLGILFFESHFPKAAKAPLPPEPDPYPYPD